MLKTTAFQWSYNPPSQIAIDIHDSQHKNTMSNYIQQTNLGDSFYQYSEFQAIITEEIQNHVRNEIGNHIKQLTLDYAGKMFGLKSLAEKIIFERTQIRENIKYCLQKLLNVIKEQANINERIQRLESIIKDKKQFVNFDIETKIQELTKKIDNLSSQMKIVKQREDKIEAIVEERELKVCQIESDIGGLETMSTRLRNKMKEKEIKIIELNTMILNLRAKMYYGKIKKNSPYGKKHKHKFSKTNKISESSPQVDSPTQ